MKYDSLYDKYVKIVKQNLNLSAEELSFKSNKDYRDVLEHVTNNLGEKYLMTIKFIKNK